MFFIAQSGWDEFDFDKVKPLPHSVVFVLEEVTLKDFSGTTSQLNLAKFLLKNGTVLKKVHFSCYYNCNKDKIAEQLSTIPRCSACLMVIFT